MPRRVPPLSPPQPSRVTAKIWRACAGITVQTPMLHSRVYYFPQGHVDQASSPPRNLSPLVHSRPYILCRVTAVEFFADPHTDEVFTKLLLQPIAPTHPLLPSDAAAAAGNAPGEAPPAEDDGDKIESYAKTLTPSDANNGGGFSVPRFCAESIFPPLNFNDDPPVQQLSVTDVHGVTWEFRHIYRGTPRRHLLTTGWSKFVNSKKLVAGDSVVFMKNSAGRMFVGIRRAVRLDTSTSGGGDHDMPDWLAEIVGLPSNAVEEKKEEEEEEDEEEEGFTRNGKGRVSAKAVAEAMEAAAQNRPFEVVYYPRVGWSEFVVSAEAVDEAMSLMWGPGLRVKMAKENEDSSRVTWHQGTVASVSANDNGPWRGSPWRMLQISWDEPESLKNAQSVSPWQVQLLSSPPSLHEAFPPTKKFRAAEDGEGDPFFPFTGFSNSTMAQLNQTLLSFGTFPAGMQGARHDLFSASTFPSFSSNNSPLYMGNSFGNNTVPRFHTRLTELNIGCSQSDGLSPDSQISLRSSSAEVAGTSNSNSNSNSVKAGSGSFQLFGATIQTEQAGEGGVHGIGGTGDDNSRGCNGTEGIRNPIADSLSYSKLLDRPLDDPRQRASTVSACFL